MASNVDLRDIYWLAGFYEGEGTAHAHKTNGGFLSAVITQKSLEPIERCLRLWGGRIYNVNNYDPNRHYSQWILSGSRAAGVLMTIYPLLTKRRQGQIAKALHTWRSIRTQKQVAAANESRRNPATGRYQSWSRGE